MQIIEDKLKQMGLALPATHPYPSPNRTACVRVGDLLFLSGHGTGRQAMPLGCRQFGKVGTEVSEQEAYVCAKAVALSMMASIKYGRHARAAVGIAELPRRAVLEIMGEFELHG